MTFETPPVVFLVDDDPSWLRALARVLRREGLEVHAFDRPDGVLERLAGVLPDLFVIDYDLGVGGTGASLAKTLRAELRASCPPLVLVSGTVESVPDAELVLFDACHGKGTPATTLVAELTARALRRASARSGAQLRSEGRADGRGEDASGSETASG